MTANPDPAIWFQAVRTGTGTDVFTECLAAELWKRGFQTQIDWLPLRAEYAPWTVPRPKPPTWANVTHVSTWLHPRFIPRHLPVVATLHHAVHDPALRPYKGALRTAYHRFWIAPNERRVLRLADRVAAVSQFAAAMACRTLCDVPMGVIYNGIDTEVFSPRKRLRPPTEPFRLLYVGSWMARKGVDLLAPIMRELGEGFILHYTGSTSPEPSKQGMPLNMVDVGRLAKEGVIAAMQNADAFLFPSRSEGLPLVVIEAMACGLPVVGVRGSSMAEAVTHGQTGLLCARDDVAALAGAIRTIAADARTFASMGLAARQSAIDRFPIQKMVEAYVRLYSELLSKT